MDRTAGAKPVNRNIMKIQCRVYKGKNTVNGKVRPYCMVYLVIVHSVT